MGKTKKGETGYFWLIKYRLKKVIIPSRITSLEFTRYLALHGVKVGKGTHFFDPTTTTVDIQRPWMLHIGEYCKVTQNVTILCHDYSRSVLRRKYGEIIGEAKETYIGDNVFIGVNSVICMGAHIGNNVIIGASSVVTGNIPDDSVVAGVPARRISSLDQYYKKRKKCYIEEGKKYAKKFYLANNRLPVEKEMGPFFPLFMKREKALLRKKDIFTKLSGDNEEELVDFFMKSEPIYPDYESFINDVFEDNSVLHARENG